MLGSARHTSVTVNLSLPKGKDKGKGKDLMEEFFRFLMGQHNSNTLTSTRALGFGRFMYRARKGFYS